MRQQKHNAKKTLIDIKNIFIMTRKRKNNKQPNISEIIPETIPEETTDANNTDNVSIVVSETQTDTLPPETTVIENLTNEELDTTLNEELDTTLNEELERLRIENAELKGIILNLEKTIEDIANKSKKQQLLKMLYDDEPTKPIQKQPIQNIKSQPLQNSKINPPNSQNTKNIKPVKTTTTTMATENETEKKTPIDIKFRRRRVL